MVAGLATLSCLTEHQLLERATQMGDKLGEGIQALAPRFEFIREVRWRGVMLGIEFKAAQSLALRSAWTMAHKLDKSLFSQAITMPLFNDHRVLTQVAGHNIDVVKLLPPMIISEQDVNWFLTAFEDVMIRLHKFPGPVWEALAHIGKFAVKSGVAKTAP